MHGLVVSSKSLINNKNWSGPSIDPTGTPQVIILLLDNSPLTLHCCSQFVKYD